MSLTRYFAIIFCLFLTKSIGQVTVETSNLKVNGVSITNNTINFNGASTVNVGLDVNLKTLDGSTNNLLGNLFIYYKASSTESEVQIGFASVTFVTNYPPFVPQINYTSTIPVTNLVINSSSFYNTGGVIFARYVNNSGTSFNGSNINVIGGSRTVAPIFNGSNSICCNQTIRYGDKPTTITGTAIPAYSGRWALSNPTAWYYGRNFANDPYSELDPDYMFESKTFTRRLAPGGTNSTSNEVTITVVPTPIISNVITTSAIATSNGNYEANQSSPVQFYGDNPIVSLNVLADPNHIYTRTDNVTSVTSYQWEYFLIGSNNKWTAILGANQANLTNFSPSSSTNLSEYKVRRIVKYNTISRVSNEITILLRKSTTTNTVCCSQLLSVTTTGYSSPSLIVGSLPVYNVSDSFYVITSNPINLTILYQWQTQSRSSAWTNIVGANSKDYLPPVITTANTTNNYRRIVRFNFTGSSSPFSYETYSSVISVSTPNRVRAKMIQLEEENTNNEITIFPNPTNSNLNILNPDNFEEFKIINSIGQLIKSDYVKSDNNLISIDVSNLSNGVYFISFEKDSKTVVKKFIKQ